MSTIDKLIDNGYYKGSKKDLPADTTVHMVDSTEDVEGAGIYVMIEQDG